MPLSWGWVEMLGAGPCCDGRAQGIAGQLPARGCHNHPTRVSRSPGVAVPVGRATPCPDISVPGQAEINIVAGYGSTKDISVYSSLGLTPAHIYIVGRAVKKFHNQCQVRWVGLGTGWGCREQLLTPPGL